MKSLVKGTALISSVVMAIGLGGCTAASNNSGNSPSPAAPEAKSVVMVVPSLPDNLTIFPYAGNASQAVLTGLGSQIGVYEHSCSSAVPGKVEGKLAESIVVSPDQKSIEVKLRPLKSQYGNTLSADDIEWSLVQYGFVIQPVLKKTFKQSGFDVDNLITKVDDHTVKFNLKSFESYSVDMFQNPLGYIYDSTEAMKHASADDPVAQKWLFTNLADYSGWKLDNFTPGQSLKVTADANWGGAARKVTEVVLQGVPDDATRQQLLQSGKAQVAVGFQYSQYKALSESPGIKVQTCPSLNMDNLMFSTREAPLNDVRVRQALSMAIDRDKLVTGAYSGYAKPAISSLNADFGIGSTGGVYTYNLKKAKQLLAEAGYPNGFELTMTYSPTRPGPVVARSSVLVQSMLAEVGVKVKLEQIASPTQMSETMYISHLYQSALYGEPVAIADPAYLSWIKFGDSPNNSGTFWKDSEMTQLLASVAQIPAEQKAERMKLFKRIAQIGDEQVPLIELVETPYVTATKDLKIGAFMPNGQISFNDFGR